MKLLSIEKLFAGYGPITVLQGIDFHVNSGEIVTLLGANGAGKSTTLRAISRLIPTLSGAISFKGKEITLCKPHEISAMGISHVPEGRGIFGNLTVYENLILATFANSKSANYQRLLSPVFDMFPLLQERLDQSASTLSGGEQQMLAIARALMADGDLLILDEPSMGLAPIFINKIFTFIKEINASGKTVLLVEQNASMALQYAHRGYVLENGKIIAEGTSHELKSNPDIKKAYLG